MRHWKLKWLWMTCGELGSHLRTEISLEQVKSLNL